MESSIGISLSLAVIGQCRGGGGKESKIQGGKAPTLLQQFSTFCVHITFSYVQYHPKERELLTFLQEGDGSLQHKVQKKPWCWKRVELICSVTVLETHQTKKVMYTKYSVLNSSVQSCLQELRVLICIPTLMPLMCDTTVARRLSLNSQMLASTSVHSYQCWSLVHVVTAMSQ